MRISSNTNYNSVIMLGCFDTKAEDFSYLYDCLQLQKVNVISINTGVMHTTESFPIDFDSEEVAKSAGTTLTELQNAGDRSVAVEKMGVGASNIISRLLTDGSAHGAIGMGGGGGTYIALSAMQSIPMGVPKLCVTTLAAKDLARQIGVKDITLMPSIVDVAGLNNISRMVIRQAAGAIAGMMAANVQETKESTGSIAISIFGNTTKCVDKCSEILKEDGYDVSTFHSVGIGGKTMESLILDGYFDAVLDITTTELADNLCDGICSSGPDRLTAASQMGIPQVVVPGCLDMVNYGHLDTVPERFKDRLLYSWSPDVTLMRTNEVENEMLGKELADKLNKSSGPVKVLLPMKGISIVSSEGGEFYRPDIDQILFDSIKKNVKDAIEVIEVDTNINDEAFAELAVDILMKMKNGQ
ncbi:MAG: hypothetical protein ACJA2S_004267 [Cyclobacteriaceae bacterium]|jgi:uncharacterized protein (UPF0261 family)